MTQRSENPFEELINLGAERLGELKALGTDMFQHVPPRTLLTMLLPPALGLDLLQGTLSGRAMRDALFDKDHYDEAMMTSVLAMARWWSKHYFTTSIHDVEKFPADKPALLVGNHSAGLMPLDALFAMNQIRDTYGEGQRVYSLVHDFAYMAPRVAKVARGMGVLRAKRENAINALQAGHHVLAYPGGDQDAFRKWEDRKKIVLADRKGFIRVALAADAPIVPLVSVGLHESFFVIADGKKLARKLGLKKTLRTDVLPISLSFPWGLVPAFFPYLPVPTSIEMQFCDPIEVHGSPDDDALVDDIYKRVNTVMQDTMDTLYKNRTPIFGRK